jgi:hypothetical protein
MMLELLQATLDGLLYPLGIPSFWNRASKIDEKRLSEYVVYTQNSSPPGLSGDNKTQISNYSLNVYYYCDRTIAETAKGRQTMQRRALEILTALEHKGFYCDSGIMWPGDIDKVGKEVAVMEITYPMAVSGEMV